MNCKNGISSYEVSRDLGVSQKSTWFMEHRIRFALHQGIFENMLSGEVEADETFIGGKHGICTATFANGRSPGRAARTKAAVMGILERGRQGRYQGHYEP